MQSSIDVLGPCRELSTVTRLEPCLFSGWPRSHAEMQGGFGVLRQRNGSRERAQAVSTSVLPGDNQACCTVVLWRQKALCSRWLPPRVTRALLFPSAQRHFHLQCHTQQHCSFCFWGNHLPLANISVATFRREGKSFPGSPCPAGWAGEEVGEL